MPYVPHTRVSLVGTNNLIPGEVWNCNVNVQRKAPDFGPLLDHDAYLAAIFGPLATWFESALSRISDHAFLNTVKANGIGADGKYIDPTTTHQHDYGAPVGGGAPSNGLWAILTCATSWTTARARGVGSHGRIFLPNYTSAPLVPGDIKIQAAEQTSIMTAGKALLAVLASSGATACDPIIASKGGRSGGPVNQVITGVRVGNIIDVQRRRKNAVLETYTSVAFP